MVNNKHVFWMAAVIALAVFWTGIVLGVIFENSRVNELEGNYFDSETDIFDYQLLSDISFDSDANCSVILERSVIFADRIFEEAVKLEKYDSSNKVTQELITLHRRYDFLRTLLWDKIIKSKKECGALVNTAVYLYEYDNPSVQTKATQAAMSNFLVDLKREYEDNLILIPIAGDTNIESLTFMREIYDLDSFPVILINEKFKFETLESLKDVSEVLIV
jgi:hypothetical protein